MNEVATELNFTEEGYLRANPDVAHAVKANIVKSGWAHFTHFGKNEGRKVETAVVQIIKDLRNLKLEKLEPLLRKDMPFIRLSSKYDYLSDDLRKETRIVETDAVSGHGYDKLCLELIEEFSEGLLLDCGAGKRPIYYDNVVNFEIVDYDTTDIIGVGEALPFVDNAFDAVISVAVLEHVRDPFKCAREIARVLKPGGKLYCSVPFLQPEHGYPHHYYNMAPQGLRALFEDMLIVDDHLVLDSVLPVWTLTWFLRSWATGLEGDIKEQFSNLTISEILSLQNDALIEQPWVKALPSAKNFELACGTCLLAHKNFKSAL